MINHTGEMTIMNINSRRREQNLTNDADRSCESHHSLSRTRRSNQRRKKRGTAKKAKKVNPRSPCSVGLGWVFWVGLRAWDFPTERARPRAPFKS
jgi:hypothetical protein